MNLANFRFETDADGIALATWDMPDRSMNVITIGVMEDLKAIVEKVVSDPAIKGCVIASGKSAFSGGADLTMLQSIGPAAARIAKEKGEEAAAAFVLENVSQFNVLFRKVETCGKPFAAAIHGACMGGAFEMTLACHFRVMAEDDKTRVGLPEIKVGLFPGGGGTQRVSRLMPTGDALQMLFKGEQIRPAAAKAAGLVHELAKREDLIAVAKEAIKSGRVSPKQPWDDPKFRAPSGKVFSPAGMQIWPPANAIYRRETYDNYPAAKAILHAVYEGLQLPMDLALKVESRWFAKIVRSKEAAAMIRSLFISMGELNKGARRPAGEATKLRKIGVVGAGFMGAGIAYVSANAGLEVVLIDRDQEAADKGKAYSHKLVSDQIMKGRAKAADRDALLARITATPDYAALADVDLVIEAVFEDPAVKADVIKKVSASIRPDCVFASNTSTLPITGLASHAAKPDQFIGIHFFSPVEKMLLVEIILAKQSGDKAIQAAFDFVRAINKTPILVNDGRGFFANRCVGNYILEGHLMLTEGVPAAMIETAAKMAGMPVGPLSLNDEVAIDLGLKIMKATEAQVGAHAVNPAQKKLLVGMVETHGRLGRKNKKGFYDYPEKGPKRLWAGLKAFQETKLDPDAIDVTELKQRFLVTQALEAARSVEEGIVTDPREADVGSIIGFGFAPYTGGVLSYIDFMGAKNFVALCDKLAAKHGKRFEPNALLRDMAAKGESFYGRYAPAKQAA
ncbi:3-hydroxyacyl-CoA dehydrogenase NAD-binding domain-containing protein [Terrarubrum flagellatum]|uniref:3-hydroxyacyl-CoA dehydrogenase NAD-binding domain-containing protein n=1 Tax=Terrirubrum flagellatum TaxID=2895980 RepID=UPI00314550CB